jgi:chromosome segregation ATPase
MATRQGRWVLILLIGVVIVSLWRTVAVEKDKRTLNTAYQQAQQSLNQIQTERDQLSTDLAAAKKVMLDKDREITDLQADLQGIQQRLDETVVELSSLQREHESLRQTNSSLAAQLASVTQEKSVLETKLSSLPELRLAIRDVKRRMSQERWAAWRARIEALREADQRALASGNRGYVLREGVSTVGAGTRLHIHVREPESAD